MDRQKCSACGQRFPSLPTDNRSRYCYQHQVYDSLMSEYKTVLNAYSTNTYWEEFLIIKLNGNEPTDVNKILDAEFKQPDGHNYSDRHSHSRIIHHSSASFSDSLCYCCQWYMMLRHTRVSNIVIVFEGV